MNSNTQKLIVGAALFLAWIGLVVGKAYKPELDTATLIAAIQSGLTGLGVYHTMSNPDQPTTPKEPS